MNDKIAQIAHAAADEIVHKSKGDPDRIEATIRGAIRKALKASCVGSAKANRKNPNRFYISE